MRIPGGNLDAGGDLSWESRGPIEAQHREVLDSIDGAFQRVQDANAVLTGYLASVVKVKQAQDSLLTTIGVPGLSDRIAGNAVKLSNALDEVLGQAEAAKDLLDKAPDKVQETQQLFEGIPDKVKSLVHH